jgi:hypothetical protein
MAGQLTIDTLRASSGVLATQNGMTGIAKAWVNFAASATPTITGSFNVSSITYTSSGYYTVNMTTAMPNINYSVVGSSSATGSAFTLVNPFTNVTNFATIAPTTSAFVLGVLTASGGSTANPAYVMASVFSS